LLADVEGIVLTVKSKVIILLVRTENPYQKVRDGESDAWVLGPYVVPWTESLFGEMKVVRSDPLIAYLAAVQYYEVVL
jgi:hypothetical protein